MENIQKKDTEKRKSLIMEKDYVLCTTSQNQNYLYSFANNQIVQIHPLLKVIIEHFKNGINIKEWLSNSNEENFILDGLNTSKGELEYHYQKFCFYKSQGYFNTIASPNLTREISALDVKQQLANLRQVTFEVTDKCNLKCEYCGYGKYYNDYDDRSNKNLEFSKAKRLLDYLIELWSSNYNTSQNNNVFISFYGGEPLMNMDFIQRVVHYVESKVPSFIRTEFSMTTNGVLLKNNIDFLIEKKFWLLVSLDGNDKNNSYRVFDDGSNSFQYVNNQIEFIRSKYPEYFQKYISFNTVLHNRNSMDELYNFFLQPTKNTLL